mgnify:FL=1
MKIFENTFGRSILGHPVVLKFRLWTSLLLLVLKDINTEAAEQTFSWLKRYANIISNMNHLRAPLFMLTLFHLKNLSRVKRSPSSVFPVVSRHFYSDFWVYVFNRLIQYRMLKVFLYHIYLLLLLSKRHQINYPILPMLLVLI